MPHIPRRHIFAAFVVKEVKHVLRDRKSLGILLGLPVVMMLLFGFALSNEVKNSNFVAIAPQLDGATTRLIERLDHSRYFTYRGQIASESELEAVFRRGDARVAVVFPPNFATDMGAGRGVHVRIIADASDANTATLISNYATSIIAQFAAELPLPLATTGHTPPLGPPRIVTEMRMLYNPQLKSAYMFVPGVMTLILMLLGAMMTSVSIVKEKERGTMEILLVSPSNPMMVILSKAVPYLVLCFIDVLIILALAYGVLDMPTGANIPLLLAMCALFIVTTLALGLVISNRVATQQTAMFISLVGLLMPALVFSGFMFPIENMPLPLRTISNLVPTRWFYQIVSNLMIKHATFSTIAKPTAVLVAMTVALLIAAKASFKQRLA